jgi:polysaccharide chain length determinant protein (PEP-CTERM system associated)
MIPGKRYTPEDLVIVAWRWKWLIILPCLIGGIGAFAYARTLKDLYRSESVIMMTPQRVREDLVRSSVRTNLAERIQTISQQILSRTRLEGIIVDLDLYPDQRRTGLMEDVVEQMRRDVSIQTVRGDAFRVAYVSESPVVAMRVTERLAGLFIDENLRDREQLAQGTSVFLQSQVDDARKRLVEQEARLAAYRTAHAGQLPSQFEANLAALNSAQTEIQRLQDLQSREREQLRLVERQLADLDVPEATPETQVDSEAGTVSGGSAAQQAEAARAALRNLELRLKPEHPDIGRLKRLIKTLEEKAEREALDAPLSARATAPRSKAELARQGQRRQLESAAERLRAAIAQKDTDQQRLRGVVADYQNRLEKAPTRETELIELTRDYNTIERMYNSLLGKSEESKLSVNLETRQVGQQFRILDPARVPARPFSPKRGRLYALGAFGGMALGGLVVFLIVYRDTSLKTDDDVIVSLGVPVLALVPMIKTSQDMRRRKQRRLMLGGATAVIALALVGGAAWWLVTRS